MDLTQQPPKFGRPQTQTRMSPTSPSNQALDSISPRRGFGTPTNAPVPSARRSPQAVPQNTPLRAQVQAPVQRPPQQVPQQAPQNQTTGQQISIGQRLNDLLAQINPKPMMQPRPMPNLPPQSSAPYGMRGPEQRQDQINQARQNYSDRDFTQTMNPGMLMTDHSMREGMSYGGADKANPAFDRAQAQIWTPENQAGMDRMNSLRNMFGGDVAAMRNYGSQMMGGSQPNREAMLREQMMTGSSYQPGQEELLRERMSTPQNYKSGANFDWQKLLGQF